MTSLKSSQNIEVVEKKKQAVMPQLCPAATAHETIHSVFQKLMELSNSVLLCCNAGPKPKVKEDDFEDLLSTQGFASRPDRKGPRTIAEMRRQEMTKDIDPLKLQVTKCYITKDVHITQNKFQMYLLVNGGSPPGLKKQKISS